jgi:type I restriction enzyme S subunit
MMRLELNDCADSRFVWYWLQSSLVREFISKNAKGTSPTMKKISQRIVMSMPFPSTLTLTEQRRIVAELDALQTEVDTLKRLQAETAAELDALLPSVLDRAFKGDL